MYNVHVNKAWGLKTLSTKLYFYSVGVLQIVECTANRSSMYTKSLEEGDMIQIKSVKEKKNMFDANNLIKKPKLMAD